MANGNFIQVYSDSTAQMGNIMAVATLAPEILVLSTGLIFLLGGVYGANRRIDRLIVALGLVVLASLAGLMTIPPLPQNRQVYFSEMFVSDGFSHFVKSMLVVATALIFLLSDGWLKRGDNQRFEFPVLMLFALLGSMLMVSANNMLSFYMSLELSSLPLYVLASMERDSGKSTESGIKYFVLSALSSGMLLFGISLTYGFTGTTSFDTLTHLLTHPGTVSGGLVVGLVLVITAMSFKVSAAPFHMWTPDVYEGAPTPVTSFFSIVPKFAALALFTRLMVQPFGALALEWRQVVIFISIASLLVGAFGALMQTNIKRLLAYGSIGHVGYALIGLAAGTPDGIGSLLIYFSLYVFMSVGAFACILMMNVNGQALENISDLAGLWRIRPFMAAALAGIMFSMAGIPPFSGFFGKLYIFLAALQSGLVALAVVGVLTSVVACYYYIRIVKTLYFDEPNVNFDREAPAGARLALIICAFITCLFFLLPAPLVAQARSAASALFTHV